MTDPSASTTRDPSGRFQPGCSGNPAGRPPGSRSEASILKEQLRGDQVDAAVQIIGDRLAAGSEATARFVIKQIDPKKRAPRVAFDYLPGASVIERFQVLFAAAANGEIAPDEALTLGRLLAHERDTVVKAAGVARDLEHDMVADQKRADAVRAKAAEAQAEAERAAAAAAAAEAKETAYWAHKRAEWDARDAQREAERAARQAAAPAADAAPFAEASGASAPAVDETPADVPALLKACSISPSVAALAAFDLAADPAAGASAKAAASPPFAEASGASAKAAEAPAA
ncbi:MAG: hypothetical protein HY060_18255, partial [Proteobacteria bacterium]|nr:hypothetical protein [Pseudomonadota bacterium]